MVAVADNVVPFPLQQSIAYAGSTLYGQGLNWPRYNPDILLTRQGLQVYDNMANDEQVKAVLKFKRDAVLSRAWAFVYDEQSEMPQEEQQSRCDILSEIVQRMKGSFADSMSFIMRAMRHGYSITEKIYDLVDIDGAAYYACTELRPKPPFTFYFKTDEFGTMLEFGQNFGGTLRPLDLRKFIHYVQDPEEDLWYGRSELRAAYRAWYTKDVLIKMQSLWLERMGGGFIVVTRDAASSDLGAADAARLDYAIANIKTISGLQLPKGYTAQIVNPPSTEAFTGAIEYHDLGIAKALLVPNLLGVSHTGKTGSYSQSQTQLEAFFWTLNADSTRLEAALNEQLFRELCELNFGDGQYPCFKFKPASEEFIKWVVSQWVSLTGASNVVSTEADEAHLRKLLNMPPRGPEDVPLVTPAQEHQQAMDKQAAASAGGKGAVQPTDISGAENYSRIKAHTKDGKPLSCSVASFSRAAARVNFAVIAQRAEGMAADGTAALAPIVAQNVARVLGDAARFLAKPDDIQDIAFSRSDMGRLNKACTAILQRGWDLGQRQAGVELSKASKNTLKRENFAALRGQKAADYLQANGYRMAGNLADGSRSIIQQELLNGVKGGMRPEVVATNIYERLINKGFTTMQAVQDTVDIRDVVDALEQAIGSTGPKETAAYLDTLARTNLFEAMNEARYEAFTDPALDGFVEALEYSAILDDRTTEICQELDGDIFASDSEQWDIYRPPNHYNCRSVLIPVTKNDGWDGTDDDPPSVEPQDGFGKGEK